MYVLYSKTTNTFINEGRPHTLAFILLHALFFLCPFLHFILNYSVSSSAAPTAIIISDKAIFVLAIGYGMPQCMPTITTLYSIEALSKIIIAVGVGAAENSV